MPGVFVVPGSAGAGAICCCCWRGELCLYLPAAHRRAIELYDQDVSFLSNRAAVHFEKGDFEECIKDCDTGTCGWVGGEKGGRLHV